MATVKILDMFFAKTWNKINLVRELKLAAKLKQYFLQRKQRSS